MNGKDTSARSTPESLVISAQEIRDLVKRVDRRADEVRDLKSRK